MEIIKRLYIREKDSMPEVSSEPVQKKKKRKNKGKNEQTNVDQLGLRNEAIVPSA